MVAMLQAENQQLIERVSNLRKSWWAMVAIVPTGT
jgi:hypothetical protein